VSDVTPFSERARTTMRGELLEAAADMLAARGFRGLRMADVATRAGVSRQTVYNEFGNKEGLAQAVALHRAAEFIDGVDSRLSTASEPFEGVRSAIEYTLDNAAKDRLVSSMLTGEGAEDLLPFLTTKGQPVLIPATEVVSRHVRRNWPRLPPEQVSLFAEATVRLALSHLLMPSGDRDHAVNAVVGVARAALPPLDPTKE
jgi:AcrR family transcriptional regulator